MIVEAHFGSPLVLTQRCDNKLCGKTNTVREDELVLGIEIAGQRGPNIIQLPRCDCGSTESLNRFPGTAPAEEVPPHLQLVNTVADYLKLVGRVNPECAAMYAEEPPHCPHSHPFTLPGEPFTLNVAVLPLDQGA